MTGETMHTHAWRLPDHEIRTDIRCREIALTTSNQQAVQVTHLPTGRAVVVADSASAPKNYETARRRVEAWVLDGVVP